MALGAAPYGDVVFCAVAGGGGSPKQAKWRAEFLDGALLRDFSKNLIADVA
jgi:hypothetical protein